MPVLKEVGVVDSGGQGLVFVLQAFYEVLSGKTIEVESYQPDNAQMDEMINAEHHRSAQGQLNPDDIKYGYCTEIMVRLGRGKQVDQEFDYDKFYEKLAGLGDSLLVVNDEEVVKVHVHTEHPGEVLAWGQEFGDLQKVKVDNMRWQQEEIMQSDEQESPVPAAEQPNGETTKTIDTAIISISSGDGIATLFKSLGVTHVINGGQTMNPSTQDIVDAINASGAKSAIVLPNNGNIFMAAEQSVDVVDIPVKIVHSKTIAQGMASLLEFNPDATLEDNQTAMEEALSTVKSGEVTVSIRDTTVDGVEIKKIIILVSLMVKSPLPILKLSKRRLIWLNQCWMKIVKLSQLSWERKAIKLTLKKLKTHYTKWTMNLKLKSMKVDNQFIHT